MGVSGLLTLLKSIQKPCNLKDFRGKTIGVDAYGWLHRGAVAAAVDLALGKPTRKYVEFSMHRVRMLIHYGIKPYLVFDGDHLPSKAGTEQDRAKRRHESRQNGLELLRVGKTAQAYQELQKTVDITPEMARQLIEALKRADVSYVVAPYEADSQLAYLERTGIIDGVLSEDSDLLVFGVNCLLTKLDQYGDCIMIRRDDFTACREVNLNGWTNADLRHMAILSGCDYLQGIHKMGLKTAYRLVRKYKNVPRIVQAAQLEGKFRIPDGYLESFDQAEKTFLYQWVFCPNARCLVNLTELGSELDLAQMYYLGEQVASDVARGVACGDLNPMTKQKIILPPEPPQRSNSWSGSRNMKTPVTTSGKVDKDGKSIDSFFKPRRIPLAELDPNLLTPSPSQQRLLQQHNSRGWLSDPAPSRAITSSQAIQVSAIDVTARHTPTFRSNKRQRLCVMSDDLQLDAATPDAETSRFFSSTKQSPVSDQSLRKPLQDINVWSDDSIEDAMVNLPEVGTVVVTNSPARPSLKTGLTGEISKANISTTPQETQDDEESTESVFSRNLKARFEYTFSTQPPALSFLSSAQTDSTMPATPPPLLETLTAPGFGTPLHSPTRTSQGNSNSNSNAEATTPNHQDHDPDIAASPDLPPLPLHAANTPTTQTHHSLNNIDDIDDNIPDSHPGLLFSTAAHKGSEDLLLIPDSDPMYDPASPSHDTGYDSDGSPGRRPAFDLRRFAFGGA